MRLSPKSQETRRRGDLRLRAYAVAGARERLKLLADEIMAMAETMPELDVRDAATKILRVAQSTPGRVPHHRKAPLTPSERKTIRHVGSARAAANRSWRIGRETLAVLADSVRALSSEAIAAKLKLRIDTALWRLKRRLDAGHIRTTNGEVGVAAEWEITPAGRAAYEQDKEE